MTDELQPESTAPDAEPKPKKPRAKKAATAAKSAKSSAKKSTTKTAKTKAAAKKTARSAGDVPAAGGSAKPIEDPIGDVSDGEARFYTGVESGADTESESQAEIEAYRAEASNDALDGTLESGSGRAETGVEADIQEQLQESIGETAENGGEPDTEMRPPAKLERLQKILSQAGIASRRRAEELIAEGRVVVNGQVVTALGSKADAARDHIRVDGKLLHGAARHRYFVLNKPKGYVTTVSDPEGRPTVMDFVSRLGERLYPVGRLDYQSEGLLLMTNDGDLANQLTRAASGVEKTYLVKVAGQPGEEALEKLRTGVAIERGQPGSPRVRTAPARIRQVRRGENPWYEVVLIEGRNRELRKMFSAVGHFVEKIRRVGYGPLALDVEPGKLRELASEEVDALRLAAEGKLKPRRLKTEAMLPKDAGRRAEARPGKRRGERGRPQEREFRPRSERPFRPREEQPRPFRGERPAQQGGQRFERPASPSRPRREREEGRFEERPRGGFRPRGERPFRPREEQPRPSRGERPARGGGQRFERPASPGRPRREREEGRFEERPRGGFRPRGDRPGFDRAEEPRRGFGGRPDRGPGRGPGKGLGKGPGKPQGRSFGKGPGSEGPGAKPFRGEQGTKPESRGHGRPSGGKARGFSKAGSKGHGAKGQGSRGPGFKGKGGGKGHGGPRSFGNRPGGKRRG